MAILSQLLIELKADTKGFSKGLDSSLKSVGSFAKSATKALAVIGTAGAAAAGAASYAFYQTINRLDELGTAAERLDINPMTFQRLQYILEQVDVPMQAFTSSIGKMQQSIGSASRGLGQYVRSFADLGLNVSELEQMNPEDQFLKIIAAISKLQNTAAKKSIGREIFGRGADNLFPAFNDDLDAISKKFDNLDLGVNERQLDQVGKLDNTFNDLRQSASTFTGVLAAELAPAIDNIIRKFTDLDNGGLKIQENARKAAIYFLDFGVSVLESVESFLKGFKSVQLFFNSMFTFIDLAMIRLSQLKNFITETTDAFFNPDKARGDQIEKTIAKYEKLGKISGGLTGAIGGAIAGAPFGPVGIVGGAAVGGMIGSTAGTEVGRFGGSLAAGTNDLFGTSKTSATKVYGAAAELEKQYIARTQESIKREGELLTSVSSLDKTFESLIRTTQEIIASEQARIGNLKQEQTLSQFQNQPQEIFRQGNQFSDRPINIKAELVEDGQVRRFTGKGKTETEITSARKTTGN